MLKNLLPLIGIALFLASCGKVAGGVGRDVASSSDSSSSSSNNSSVVVNSAIDLTQSTVTRSSASLALAGTSTITLTLKNSSGVQVADATQTANLSIALTGAGTSTGTFTALTAVGGNDGAYQATFTATGEGTITNIKISLAAVGDFVAQPTIIVPITIPSAPTAASATVASSTSITLGWTDNSYNETGFEIERSTTSAGAGFTTLTTTAAGAVAYTDTLLTPTTQYWYRIRAVNTAGNSAYTAVVTATPPNIPAAPVGFAAVAGVANVALSWTASAGATSYTVYRGTASSGPYSDTITAPATVAGISYTDLTALNGTTYYYVVVASNAGGTSANSSEVSATPKALPAAPTGLAVTVYPMPNPSVLVSWTDNSSNETSFKIERSTTSAVAGFSALVTTAANATSYTDTTVAGGNTYWYRIYADNGNTGGVSSTTAAVTAVVAGNATHFTVTGYPNANAGISQTITVTALDGNNVTAVGYTGTVTFTSSDGSASLPSNYTFVSGDAGVKTFSTTLMLAGTHTITATDTVTGTITGSQTGIVISVGAIAKFRFATPGPAPSSLVCSALTLRSTDLGVNPVAVTTMVTAGISDSSVGTFYSDATCATPITQMTIAGAASSSATFYYRTTDTGAIPLTATFVSGTPTLANSTNSITFAPTVSSIGASGATSIWKATSASQYPARGINDQLYNPVGVTFDGTNMYVSDFGISRIVKYSNTGSFSWIGSINTAPTGGGGACNGASGFTPNWCTGGTVISANTGFSTPKKIIADGTTYLYVADTANHAIRRVKQADGQSDGWIGIAQSASPAFSNGTGASPTCVGLAATNVTPAWCIGGTAGSSATTTSGTFSAGLNNPQGVTFDTVYVYVTDTNNHRVNRYNKTTGAFAGWIGKIGATSPTLPAACSGATTYTPDWCMDGSSASVTNTGSGFKSPVGIWIDSSSDPTLVASTLYVVDSSNNRVLQIGSKTGDYRGWIGFVAGTLSGSAGTGYGDSPTCNGTLNASTPGWCIGGTSTFSSSGVASGLGNPQGIFGDATYLYVADSGNGRIARFDKTTGTFRGRIGMVSSTPTGDAPGYAGGLCSSTASGSVTPGWCYGGGTSLGRLAAIGQMLNPNDITSDGTNLYVTDSSNANVLLFNQTTGTSAGWIGATTITPSPLTWATATPTVSIESSVDDSSSDTARQIFVNGSSLYQADTNNNRIKRFALSTGLFTGWIGAILNPPTGGQGSCSGATGTTPDWCTGGTASFGTSTGDGGLSGPRGVYIDGSDLYVADTDNMRIKKMNLSTGVTAGWYGRISSSGLAATTWTTGSSGQSGTGDGMFLKTNAITGENTGSTNYLYVLDSTRVQRIDISGANPVFAGWIGKISATGTTSDATGSPGGCSGAASTVTPGWCNGGIAQAGTTTGDGGINASIGIAIYGSYLYVLDQAGRVNRYDKTTGTFAGWIGATSASGITGMTCAAATPLNSTVTPGWCYNGTTANSVAANGNISFARGIYVDSTGIYVADAPGSSARVNKYNTTSGAYIGWKGVVSFSSPTNTGLPYYAGQATNPASCVGLANNAVTPDWCVNGNNKNVPSPTAPMGGFRNLYGIGGDANYIYLSDTGLNRIQRITK